MSKYVRDWEWGTRFPNFRKSEFKCPKYCSGYGNGIASSLVEVLQNLRNKYGSLNITSGYRCKKYNSELKGASANSWHLEGQAADFYFVSGILASQSKREKVVKEIKKMANVHYSYCNVNGNHPNMGSAIHVDTYLNDIDVMEWQAMMNGQYKLKLTKDGSYGELSQAAANKNYLYRGKNAPIHITWLQQQLKWRGYDLGKYGIDGSFGPQVEKCLKQFQKDHKLKQDGKCGSDTTRELLFN